MKKISAIISVLLLTVLLCACGEQNTINIDPAVTPNTITNMVPDPEPLPSAEERLSGEWYTQQYGMIITMTLDAGGEYSISLAASQQKTAEGTWVLKDGSIFLDGDEEADLNVIDDQLLWIDSGLVFSRERPQVYSPGEAVRAEEGDLDGYWKVKYVKVSDSYVSAEILDDNTDVYIEGNNVALGGAIFGDALAEFTFEDGRLLLVNGEGENTMTIEIELLGDGNMRLTAASEDPVVLILERNAASDKN